MGWLAGIDGCPGGWLVATQGDGPISLSLLRHISELAELGPFDAVAIDMPIGLLERGQRECDRLARIRLGGRGSSIFPAPIRPILHAKTRLEADQIQRAIEGRGVSAQSFNLFRKVAEVDAWLRECPDWAARTFECHPELAFQAMNEGQPLPPKKTSEGAALREKLLGDVPSWSWPRKFVQPDDVRDALACLWSAGRYARGEAEFLPAEAPRDTTGLPMRIGF